MIPGKHNGPGWGTRTAAGNSSADTPSIPDVSIRVAGRSIPLQANHLEQITVRMMQDTIAQATRGYWHRRADVLDDARPRFGDFHGEASRESLRARYDRLTGQAEQCRIHGDLFEHDGVDAVLVAELLGFDNLQLIGDAMEQDAARWPAEGMAA